MRIRNGSGAVLSQLCNRLVGALARPARPPADELHARYADDTLLVSYPQSGASWLSFMIANYMTGNRCSGADYRQYVPDLQRNPQDAAAAVRPRIFRTHARPGARPGRVIYLVRDGRDVAVAVYQRLLRGPDLQRALSFDAFLERFNAGSVNESGSWSTHVLGWCNRPAETLVVRYEDLHASAARELRRVLQFAGHEAEPYRIATAIEASSFERMHAIEAQQGDGAHDPRTACSADSYPANCGRGIGDWSNHFSEAQVVEFIRSHEPALQRLGYLNETAMHPDPDHRRAKAATTR